MISNNLADEGSILTNLWSNTLWKAACVLTKQLPSWQLLVPDQQHCHHGVRPAAGGCGLGKGVSE